MGKINEDMNKEVKLTKEYIAGFFDGEGYVKWERYFKSDGNLKHSGIVILLGQKTKKVLEKIKEYWENRDCKKVCLYTTKWKKKYDGYVIRVANTNDAFIILNEIKDLVIVKKEDVKLALNEIKLFRKRRDTKPLNEKEIKELYGKGLSTCRISKIFKCKKGRIANVIRKNNLMRTKKEASLIRFNGGKI